MNKPEALAELDNLKDQIAGIYARLEAVRKAGVIPQTGLMKLTCATCAQLHYQACQLALNASSEPKTDNEHT